MSIASEITRINTNIANAYTKISDRGGTLPVTQNSANLADTIDTIPQGSANVEYKDVNFIDYDGTLLYSYTTQEAQALQELPALPTHEGLTGQAWNYTLAEVQGLTEGIIGANYITDDGKTRIYISLSENARKLITLAFDQSVSNGVEIDWGDGTAIQTLNYTGTRSTEHTYSQAGEYVIKLNPLNDCKLSLGGDSYSYNVMGVFNWQNSNQNSAINKMVYKIEMGKNVEKIGAYTFQSMNNIRTISIPTTVTSTGDYCCQSNTSLKGIVIPRGTTSIGNYSFTHNFSLINISLPKSIQSVGDNAFYDCRTLKNIILTGNVLTIGNNIFYNNYAVEKIILSDTISSIGYSSFNNNVLLKKFKIPSALTQISNSLFANCESLEALIFPSGITSIGNSAFYGCKNMTKYDFSSVQQIPTLGSSAFEAIQNDAKIIVPDALYEDWKAASNWSSYASKIIKASEA